MANIDGTWGWGNPDNQVNTPEPKKVDDVVDTGWNDFEVPAPSVGEFPPLEGELPAAEPEATLTEDNPGAPEPEVISEVSEPSDVTPEPSTVEETTEARSIDIYAIIDELNIPYALGKVVETALTPHTWDELNIDELCGCLERGKGSIKTPVNLSINRTMFNLSYTLGLTYFSGRLIEYIVSYAATTDDRILDAAVVFLRDCAAVVTRG